MEQHKCKDGTIHKTADGSVCDIAFDEGKWMMNPPGVWLTGNICPFCGEELPELPEYEGWYNVKSFDDICKAYKGPLGWVVVFDDGSAKMNMSNDTFFNERGFKIICRIDMDKE